jgi:CDP-paratose 2-epimerase
LNGACGIGNRPLPAVGVLEWFLPNERERAERVVAGLLELGVTHVRTGISWADWHDLGGRDWYAWLLPRLAAHFEVLPCVVCTPPSIGLAPKIQSPPRRARDYADFVDVLITEHGDCFETIEFWNEPNNLNDWDWTLDPSWNLFAEMIRDAAHWARVRGKRTVLGGMCPFDPHWLGLMGDRDVLRFIDAVGVHAFPGSWETIWDGWASVVERTQAVLDAHGCDAEIWVTETGYSTWRHDEHAQLRAFVDALAAPVPRVYWYAAEDLGPSRAACDGFHVDVRHYHFGLSCSDGRPKLLHRVWREGGLAAVQACATISELEPRRRRRGAHTLITGGAGFVGTNLADRLAEEGRRVVVLDSLHRTGVESNLRWLLNRHGDLIRAEIADVRDARAVARVVEGADQVFHFAAQVAVTSSLTAPLEDFGVNLQGTLTLLEALRSLEEPPPLLFTSTNKVYGSLPELRLVRAGGRWEPRDERIRAHGLDERVPLDFCTPYGCSKGGADQYVLDYAKHHGLQAVVFRMSCIYGPHQHGNEDQGWLAHFLIRALDDLPITVYGDGAQVRDVLFVDDLVAAMLAARERIAALSGRPFNMGGGPDNAVSLLEIVELIGELRRRGPRLVFAEERAGDQRYYVADTARFREATGWRPRVGVTEGIERLHRWLTEGRVGTELRAVAP